MNVKTACMNLMKIWIFFLLTFVTFSLASAFNMKHFEQYDVLPPGTVLF